ncbi:unnamed protein product [Merluccius merluccius]
MEHFMNLCKIICLMMPLRIMELLGLRGMYKRVFPFLAYNITFSYNEKMHTVKRDLFRNMYKFTNEDNTLRLLEIGCGSGANFPYYPDGCTVTCTDPNPHFERYLRRSMAANKHLTYEPFLVLSGEHLEEVADGSVDVVVCTLVLCSVSDVPRVLGEARRILKTGGALYFLEHVAAQRGSWTRVLQHALRPVWSWLGDGCVVTRETGRHLEAAGFSQLHLAHVDAPRVTFAVRPHVVGFAIK